MAISVEAVKELRERTGMGIMECKRALEEAGGDREKAVAILKERGVAVAASRSLREATQGVIDAYIHSDGRLGAIVELNCETDFVARTDAFRALAHDLAMQVAATDPRYIAPQEMHGDQGDPDESCLLLQPFIKDSGRIIQDIINDVIAQTGENVRVRRFVRFELGR